MSSGESGPPEAAPSDAAPVAEAVSSSGSASGSSGAATGTLTDQQRAQLAQAADAMFAKMGAYVESELGVAKEDYLLLQMMNNLVKSNYSGMSQLAEHLNVLMHSLQEKYTTFQPYLNQIDQLDDNISQLEEATKRLDDYSRQLESRFKKVLKV